MIIENTMDIVKDNAVSIVLLKIRPNLIQPYSAFSIIWNRIRVPMELNLVKKNSFNDILIRNKIKYFHVSALLSLKGIE